MIIDSHHHFWKYNPVEYGWIGDNMKMLRRDFLPSDLKEEIDAAGVDAVITVQARQSIEETRWLLQFSNDNSFISGVVGWLPIISNDFIQLLELFSEEKKLVSLRHVIHDETDPGFILRKDFNQGISRLKDFGLVYDILIYENQLPGAITFVDNHPSQIFVLDHIAKPRICENILSPWRENIMELAKRENVFCKLSGIATEADLNCWTKEQIFPYFETCLDVFGPRRLMFGSDWPVCISAVTYKDWLNLLKEFISVISRDEQREIMQGTAIRAYGLSDSMN